MDRKWIILLLVALILISCKSMKRSDVVDVLIDNSYTRNEVGFYVKSEVDYIIRIGYRRSIDGYLESLANYYGPGPSAVVDVGNDVSYNYHLNEDAMLYNIYCAKNMVLLNSEVMYTFKDRKFVVGTDNCEFNSEKQDSLIEEFNLKKELIMDELDKLKLGKKELSLLK